MLLATVLLLPYALCHRIQNNTLCIKKKRKREREMIIKTKKVIPVKLRK